MDITEIPVLDNHCHFFSIAFDETPLHRALSLSLNSMPDDQLRHSLMYRNLLIELSDLLECSPDEETVLAARRNMASRYKEWVKTLWEHVNLQWLLVDIGLEKSSVDFHLFEELVPAHVRYVYRLESIVDELWAKKVPAEDARILMRDHIERFVSSLHIVAVKSIIGYRSGLEIDPSTTWKDVDMEVEASYRNFLFLEAAALCREASLPFHVHAAFGESNIDLRTNNPLHLKPFLDSEAGKEVPIVLIHGGYPYTFEAGYLAAMYPNVYVDISEFIPFVPLGMRRGLEDIMSMCPLNKVLYGSDGFSQPETHWFGAKMAKDTLGELTEGLVKQRKITSTYRETLLRGILCENSLQLHKLA